LDLTITVTRRTTAADLGTVFTPANLLESNNCAVSIENLTFDMTVEFLRAEVDFDPASEIILATHPTSVPLRNDGVFRNVLAVMANSNVEFTTWRVVAKNVAVLPYF
jgi:hypothetical protein